VFPLSISDQDVGLFDGLCHVGVNLSRANKSCFLYKGFLFFFAIFEFLFSATIVVLAPLFSFLRTMVSTCHGLTLPFDKD